MTDEQRREHGLEKRMPRTLDEALTALQGDEELAKRLPAGLAEDYLAMKRAEQEMLGKMGEAERRVWLIERY
ncbi:MAG: hypothetical protein INR71_14520 [Terriglobus roseus]|nr:hypothetical protein [Terriglobus roseus]